MKISDILLNLEIPSNEIKIRFKNKQIKLNGEIINNIELDVNENFIMELGDFLTSFYNNKQLNSVNMWMKIGNYKINEMFGESSNIQFLDVLETFQCLTTSKNEHYILMKS